MKRFFAPILVSVAMSLSYNASPADAPGPAWAGVEEAIRQGQPRTALERLEPILQEAMTRGAWPEAALALARKIDLETQIQGNQPQERVRRFREALENTPATLHPVLHALLAHAYWAYFEQNRWRIGTRTATAGESGGDDFEAWDIRRLFREMDHQFSLALTNAAALRVIPVAQYRPVVEPGTMPERYRPTLHDFLAHEALEFYTAGEQAGARPQDAFEIPADSPALGDAEAFLEWNPSTTDTNAAAFKAIRLYQEVLRLHRDDEDRSAFLDTDLHRLVYARNNAVGADRDERYLAALRRFIEQAGDHEIAAMARHHEARLLQRLDRLAEAHAAASEGARRHGDSIGGRLCANVMRELEAPDARLQTERVWNQPWPEIQVAHRNLSRLWFRVIPSDWDELLASSPGNPEDVSLEKRRALLEETPRLAWAADLPPTPDFKERLTAIRAPQDLPAGFYFLIASRTESFGEEDNIVMAAPIWVSDLALVVRTRAGLWEGILTEAATGEPVQGARVEISHLRRDGRRVSAPAVTTDGDGTFRFRPEENSRAYVLKATHRGRIITYTEQRWWGARTAERPAREQTVFFTDRALYRPGQTIHYKGISLSANQARGRYEVLSGRQVTVVLRDANGREISRVRHRSNDFGSFSGAFTAPSHGLTGTMQIAVEEGPVGGTTIQVEEYKRPRFHVEVSAPAEPPRLRGPVSLTGRATAYTGAPIDGAAVSWRVVRQVRFPPWLGWFRPAPIGVGAQEIAHGTATTRADGSFTIQFDAVPDATVPPADEPVFRFEVHADVTDTAGETRAATRTIAVGYTALAAELGADSWQTSTNPVPITVRTTTLDGEGAPASGTLRIHRLQEPDRVHRTPITDVSVFRPGDTNHPPDLSNPDEWELGPVIAEQSFRTGTEGLATNRFNLAPGAYRAVLETRDRFGTNVTARVPLLVLDPDADSLGIPIPFLLQARSWTVEPGEELVAVWGSGYPSARAFIEVEVGDELTRRFWTEPGRTQQAIRIPVTEAMRGGFTLHVTQVRENRAYTQSRHVDVPWSNKRFDVEWGTFRSKLMPGQEETWTATIRPRKAPGGDGHAGDRADASSARVAAEMVATLYDASLDAFMPFGWPEQFHVFPTHRSTASTGFANAGQWFIYLHGRHDLALLEVEVRYPRFPFDFTRHGRMAPVLMYRDQPGVMRRMALGAELAIADQAGQPAPLEGLAATAADGSAKVAEAAVQDRDDPAPDSAPDPSLAGARRNLQETAFFLPHLVADSNGVVTMKFTMPEALTEWRFLGFAHDRQLRGGLLEDRTVTAKDLMVQPNPPRFLREGDVLEFTTRVVNQSASRQTGRVRLDLRFAADNEPANEVVGNTQPEQSFDIPAKESATVSWRITVPDGCGFLTFRVTAASGSLSDGEEGYLPVLSRRVFLTESMPLPIRGPGSRTFTFESLREGFRSDSVQHAGLTVQMVSNPAWYAVLALPYLMESPHECSEQIFNRYYANALARHLVASRPRIREIFEQWRGTPALESPLEKNAELKAVAVEETPWLRQARGETEARRKIALLFEGNRLEQELDRALRQLAEMQLADGGWPWFPGGPRDEFITLYIVTGFGRMRDLGIEVPLDAPLRALAGLDAWMHERWIRLREEQREDDPHLDPTAALYLYGRSFFLKDRPVEDAHREAFNYWVNQAREHWLTLGHRLPRGHVALALHRIGGRAGQDVPRAIIRSLREHAVTDDELGMFWREDERSWWWYRAPIETQALMIEAFDAIAGDAEAVENMKVWLLKQKQTQGWRSTKATADAVHALLRRGADLLSDGALARVEIGGRDLTPGRGPAPDPAASPGRRRPGAAADRPEPGTGFYELVIPGGQVTEGMAEVRVTKPNAGVSWGSVHWQYFEDLGKVRAFDDTPLRLTKSLFTRVNTPAGPELVPLSGAAGVGDEIVVRVELRVDRDMEYVHLKDQRGSGTEPVNVLSRHRFQDGLAYYESTRDTASHFFISYLPRGTYVFEYPVRVQHRGEYPMGFASVQCLYAPEFNSHSASVPFRVE